MILKNKLSRKIATYEDSQVAIFVIGQHLVHTGKPCSAARHFKRSRMRDLDTVIHGIFNWTKAANYNKETISIDRNRTTAEAFADEFMKLKKSEILKS